MPLFKVTTEHHHRADEKLLEFIEADNAELAILEANRLGHKPFHFYYAEEVQVKKAMNSKEQYTKKVNKHIGRQYQVR